MGRCCSHTICAHPVGLCSESVSYTQLDVYKRQRIVLVAGPSSSGKTTFTKRLRLQLMANYLRPHQRSLDNYFVAREFTPLDLSLIHI